MKKILVLMTALVISYLKAVDAGRSLDANIEKVRATVKTAE